MTANPTVTRRNFLLGAALCATMLSGCNQGDGGQAAAEDQPAAAPAAGGNVLVAYYSAQGHTAAVAQTIADELGADLFKVTPTEPYSDNDLDWTDDSSRVTREHEDESLRDVELTQVTPDGWENYDTVLVGYPIWWGIAAWPIDNFISGNDWDGKTVLPFCTSSSSSLGRSGELLAEAAGSGESGCFNSASLNLGSPGVLHGNRTLLLQTPEGQIEPSHSVAAGLDYPGVGPEHAYLKKTGRAKYGMVRDGRALAAFERLSQTEGILPALESSHALAWVFDHPQELPAGGNVIVNLSGRGDKDMDIIKQYLGNKYHMPEESED